MSSQAKEKILNGAIQIAEELLTIAEKDANGIAFPTLGMNVNLKMFHDKTDDMYTGVAGIALFFLELYKHTGEKKYLSTATEAMRWVEHYCTEKPSDNYAFYTGRSGVAYAFLQFYRFTNDKKYLETALKIIKDCQNFFRMNPVPDDVVNGIAGTLLVLLHLHAATNEKELLKDIVFFVEHLMKRACLGRVGIYWDRSGNVAKGLCGFSHGAGGIGFVFLELANYFDNKGFYWMAEEAFAYENSLFDNGMGNWPDLRKGMYYEQDFIDNREAFVKKDMDFFTKGKDFIAWCHGAPGIGLSRIRAHELTGKTEYKKQLEAAVNKTIRHAEHSNEESSFIQCHGTGGNADLLIEAYLQYGDQRYWSVAETVAEKALAAKEKYKSYLSGFWAAGREEDSSLFMGKAGVGYFYLRMLDPRKTSSLLYTKVDAGKDENRKLSAYFSKPSYPAELKKRMLQKNFGLSIAIAEKTIPEQMETYFMQQEDPVKGGSLKEKFIRFMNASISSLEGNQQKVLNDIFQLEAEKSRMDDGIPSYSLLAAKEMVYSTNARPLLMDETELLKAELRADEQLKITGTSWNWGLIEGNEDWQDNVSKPPAPEKFNVLLKPTPMGIEERYLNDFSSAVFDSFREKRKTDDALRDILDNFGELTKEEEEMATKSIVQQIREFVASGILLSETDAGAV